MPDLCTHFAPDDPTCETLGPSDHTTTFSQREDEVCIYQTIIHEHCIPKPLPEPGLVGLGVCLVALGVLGWRRRKSK